MGRFEFIQSLEGLIRHLAATQQWSEHAKVCLVLSEVKAKAWCRGCGEYQSECSCDSRQEAWR